MMIRISLSLFLTFLISVASWQIDSNIVFKASRGSWPIPIDDINEIVTFTEVTKSMRGCPNPGISFLSKKTGAVRCVFDGQVIMVWNFHEIKMMIVKYGNYFITYSGLKDVFVKKDDFLKAGQSIGTIFGDDDHLFELEIYLNTREMLTLDPEPWFGSSLHELVRRKFD